MCTMSEYMTESEAIKKYMDFVDFEGAWHKDRPNRTWKEVVERDMKSLEINKEEALVCSNWRRLIRGTDGDSDDGG